MTPFRSRCRYIVPVQAIFSNLTRDSTQWSSVQFWDQMFHLVSVLWWIAEEARVCFSVQQTRSSISPFCMLHSISVFQFKEMMIVRLKFGEILVNRKVNVGIYVPKLLQHGCSPLRPPPLNCTPNRGKHFLKYTIKIWIVWYRHNSDMDIWLFLLRLKYNKFYQDWLWVCVYLPYTVMWLISWILGISI